MTRRTHAPRDWPATAARVGEALPTARLHPVAWQRIEELLGRGRRKVAVAFSGGADSLAALLLVWAHFPGARDRVVALHFNHRLRGAAASADERFCRRVCAALGVAVVIGRWERRTRGARTDCSEAEAREARQAFFAREMKRRRIRVLVLGHQQDDVAETMLMRLARGSGTAGLAAPRPRQVQGDGREHVRPLLALSKADVVAVLRAAGAEWREDATNATDVFVRNRVRRSLLPALARATGRDVRAAAALSRERLQEDDDALEAWLEELAPLQARPVVLHLTKLAGKPRALWRRALHRWLLAARVDTDLSRAGFEQLLVAIERGKDTRFSLGARAFAVVADGRLKVARR